MAARPFTIAVSDEAIAHLKRRIAEMRWPDEVNDADWSYGASLPFMRRVADHWATGFDWRARESKLNELPHFTLPVDGIDVHFIHQRGSGPAPFPLVITHGWPGSFSEMIPVLPMLTDPASFGGDPADAFDVVIPSLPGHGFSSRPTEAGWSPKRAARAWSVLMRTLGYDRYGAQGGDAGASVTTWLAWLFPEQVTGLHLNWIPGFFQPYMGEGERPLSEAELTFRAQLDRWFTQEFAYGLLHRTKPQTPAYALNDSPIGLAAWILEKVRVLMDCDGDIEKSVPLDTWLEIVSTYWFTETIGSSMRFYKEAALDPVHFGKGDRILPPLGYASFPKETAQPPREWAERVYTVTRWTEMKRGGHFAALECPEAFAEEVRAFFRPLRSGEMA